MVEEQPPDQSPPSGSRALRSWKEIAAYFGVSVRTVQNWEAERGLPLHRLPGAKGRVWADAAELDEWARTGPKADIPHSTAGRVPIRKSLRAWLAGAALIVLAALLAGWAYRTAFSNRISTWRVSGSSLTAFDQAGRALWTAPLPSPILDGERALRFGSPIQSRLADVTGDGVAELLFHYVPVEWAPRPERLLCFDSSGRLLWTFDPQFRLRTGEGIAGPPWSIRQVSLLPRPHGGVDPVVAVSHDHSFAGGIFRLNAQGQIARQYWHAGHVNRLLVHDLDLDGRPEIYAAGIANARLSLDVVALDPDLFAGASHEPEPKFRIEGFGPPVERGRVTVPPTPLCKQVHLYNVPEDLFVEGNQLIVVTRELAGSPTGEGAASYQVVFRAGLKPAAYRSNDSILFSYRQFALAGKLASGDPEPDLRRVLAGIQTITPWH